MYPSTISRTRSDRVQVEVDPAALYAGTQFRALREMTKTAGATAQAATVGDEMNAVLGVPNGSVSHYKFTNPGNSDSTCIFALRWEELPIK